MPFCACHVPGCLCPEHCQCKKCQGVWQTEGRPCGNDVETEGQFCTACQEPLVLRAMGASWAS